MSLRIVFMGTPDFAVPVLAEIIGQGHEVVAVYTRAPAQSGRGLAERPSPVHAMAERFGIPVFTPKTLRTDEAAETFASLEADAAVVVAYGMLLPKAILDAPELGCLNLHASLLPRWRGAAPIQRAIMAGDAETGVAVMKMEEGLDTGPVAMVERVTIGPQTTAGELHDNLSRLGADLMARALAALSRGALSFVPQPDDGVTYARKITNEEARIDWSRSASALHNQIRGLSPFPSAFFEIDLGKGRERVRALRSTPAEGQGAAGTLLDGQFTVACGEGALRLLQVQRAGKGVMNADDFLRGARLAPGTVLA
ncbi:MULTISPECIES: methionyl-tRNA formyltransferase [unclassified Chelatococcus]|uniref:methionyl-tRNA formyltransferase n=1 Tax=unclassified Chelatococcus TaxID=2638111 RepID=UPI001BCDD92A|nr:MULTISPECIES: methionyl-tRNA formyltransferase [unclassified Chelatococcus]CAH1652064.1 10-formyltetrahydrofolate:L-methionyl-tRNA(fMet) N-formyltransferase [Hyphomicrobiales bacterium]MBS7739935.1 methionyl-tRNA formyltransferase [Chelatococcus sp. HY11]MBX3545639.1 methionyl-tRNA formyltransferase [Chelatococcus sp.]MCO5078765.1 methionyl-tRNA formyltransferase [Chelatococcus sp.]CAH1686098.1 10-formyltetrahydrofolate:L-methionyl-tRNA(fMet) N-formyltransferase [Hyphomicrobiales bacterium]